MSEKLIYIDGVGSVLFKHSYRARHLNITVRPFMGARVSVPVGMSYNSAIRIATERKHWIKKHLDKMKRVETNQTRFDENSGYCTKHHQLILRSEKRNNISVRISNGKINVVYPEEINSNSIEIQNAIRKGVERALKIEANEYLPQKVKVLAAKTGFSFNKLTLKNIKSRWGSCSKMRNINLSIHLMRLPEHLIDYVILHELAHTVHLNHSAKFWLLLDNVTGGAKTLDKELRNYSISIY
ncbi:MAG TPA: M48 family peptidase [Ignavibacteriales bacterium]|nr:M48 family peptidase [Ignavibacteriales bacterium]